MSSKKTKETKEMIEKLGQAFEAYMTNNNSMKMLVRDVIRPFAEATVYNPNRSSDKHTNRTMNVKRVDIDRLQELYTALCQHLDNK